MSSGPEYSTKSPERSSIEILPILRLRCISDARLVHEEVQPEQEQGSSAHPCDPKYSSIRVTGCKWGTEYAMTPPVVVMPTKSLWPVHRQYISIWPHHANRRSPSSPPNNPANWQNKRTVPGNVKDLLESLILAQFDFCKPLPIHIHRRAYTLTTRGDPKTMRRGILFAATVDMSGIDSLL
jgi:hypothetical protein